ncbi:MAG: hypothetical protein SFU25_11395 [Candidatus Caenarcaniphilales bacterium]|nr:hypothetical protein [Candidatus Caenarcaniphilales bacterium]
MTLPAKRIASGLVYACMWLLDDNKRASLQKTISEWSNSYHFVSNWRVKGTVQEVYEILFEDKALTKWWPSVYLDVKVLDPGEEKQDQKGLGKIVSLKTKGWLPYILNWKFRVVETNKPFRFLIESWGDLNGTGVWQLKQNGQFVDVLFDWRVRADKAFIRYLSFILKPVFSANHAWSMQRGEESLRLELLRRRAKSEAERKRIPAPPGPTPSNPLPYVAGAVLGVWLVSKVFNLLTNKK